MSACRKPCPACPWRVDQDAAAIPHFSLDLAEQLAGTCPDDRNMGPDFGSAQFACHQSRPGAAIVCAGWLAVVGHRHPAVRVAVLTGATPHEALSPGEDWPELHSHYGEVIEKLRATA
jgi:Family of unknown function (DUF6283)